MNTRRIILIMASLVMLNACYGTKAPPPIMSANPPPGIGNPSSISSITLPTNVREMLAVYRQAQVEKMHHVSHSAAEKYADIETASLARQYEGKENELRIELTRRLRSVRDPAISQSTNPNRVTSTNLIGSAASAPPTATAYPPEPIDEKRGAAK